MDPMRVWAMRCGHGAFVMLAGMYFMTDVVLLRVLGIVANSLDMCYCFKVAATPLWLYAPLTEMLGIVARNVPVDLNWIRGVSGEVDDSANALADSAPPIRLPPASRSTTEHATESPAKIDCVHEMALFDRSAVDAATVTGANVRPNAASLAKVTWPVAFGVIRSTNASAEKEEDDEDSAPTTTATGNTSPDDDA